jgi:hypothetical protein
MELQENAHMYTHRHTHIHTRTQTCTHTVCTFCPLPMIASPQEQAPGHDGVSGPPAMQMGNQVKLLAPE